MSVPGLKDSIIASSKELINECKSEIQWNDVYVVFTSQAQRDAKKIGNSYLKTKCLDLIEILKQNPFQNPPPYEKLIGDLSGFFSRRINIQHKICCGIRDKVIIKKSLEEMNLKIALKNDRLMRSLTGYKGIRDIDRSI